MLLKTIHLYLEYLPGPKRMVQGDDPQPQQVKKIYRLQEF